jgi:hypothetical protein
MQAAKMKAIKKIFLFLVFINISFLLASLDEKSLIYPKVILMKPDTAIKDPVFQEIIYETESVFDKLDQNSDIIFLKEENWISKKDLLKDFNNFENLSKFYLDRKSVV